MATFAEEWAEEQNITIEEARQSIQAWLGHKSNKECWCEEHEEEE